MKASAEQRAEVLYVLLVDDEPLQLSLIPLIMRNFDPALKVEVLADPAKAVEMVVKQHYDAVVVDYSMPELSGLKLIRALKEIRDDVPCILYTGRGSEEVERAANAAGVDDYIKKIDNPNDYGKLVERIRFAVEKSRNLRRWK